MARHTKDKGPAINADSVLRLFRQHGRPMTRAAVMRGLKAHKRHKGRIREVLRELAAKGRIIRFKKGSWGLTDSMRQTTGRLEVQRSGVGFVIPDDKRRSDIFIHPKNFGEAWNGDRVVVALMPGRTGRRMEGRIVRVLERALEKVPVQAVKRTGNLMFCRATDPRLHANFVLDMGDLKEVPEPGDVLLVSPVEQLEKDLWSAELEESLGREDDLDVQERLVKINHSIPTSFPKSVLAEADNLPPVPSEEDMQDRTDLRHIPFVTIDGAMAKDFDDAIHVEEHAKGFTLMVAIADVSHYVPMGSRLDREARERGNSYYFPRSVEPMFPEKLSNGLCSLNPGVDRLVMGATIEFDRQGHPVETSFYNGVIRSHARLTYAQVNRALFSEDPGERETERKAIAGSMPMLEKAEKLARLTSALRSSRGSLDFDLPEPDVVFNLYGEAVDVRPKVRNFVHQIIEEFMVAANEAVARFLTDQKSPCMYRVHPSPDRDKLSTLNRTLSRIGLPEALPNQVTAKDLQNLLHKVEDTPLEYLVNRLTLRSMMQASYTPELDIHFGLASTCYCHFTSPIRRYADLMVHRSLKQILAARQGLAPAMNIKGLAKLGRDLSETERRAMEAEREMLSRVAILILRDRVGDLFHGVVNSVSDFGFWVELTEVMAEGLVRLSTMDDDYYGLIPDRMELVGERTGRTIRMGDEVSVRLVDVNMGRLEVDLELESMKKEALPA